MIKDVLGVRSVAVLATCGIVGVGARPTEAMGLQDPGVVGQWLPASDLELSCDDPETCAEDEIGHATLIPVGPHKGRILVWTKCDDTGAREPGCGLSSARPYTSRIIDPLTETVVAEFSFEAALPGKEGLTEPQMVEGVPGVVELPERDLTFCSGHMWILDGDKNPKLLVVGGIRSDGAGTPFQHYTSRQAFWFDPISTSLGWSNGPDELPDQSGPGDFPCGSWYPSLVLYKDPSANRFLALALGGTRRVSPAPDGSDQFTGTWLMSSSYTWSINANPGDYEWHMYNRALLLTGAAPAYAGEVLSAGHAHTYWELPQQGFLNPCRKIDTSVVP